MYQDLLSVMLFVALAAPAFFFLTRFLDSGRVRLNTLTHKDSLICSYFRLPESLVRLIGSMGPGDKKDRTLELMILLRSAGYDHPEALAYYRTIRFFLVLFALGVTAFIGTIVHDLMVLPTLFGGLGTSLMAFCLPWLVITIRSRIRATAIARGLPFAMDLMAISLQSGLDPVSSTRRVAKVLRRPYPDLGFEFQRVFQMAQVHTMEKAWQSFASHVASTEVRNLCSIMIQSEQVGSDAVTALIEYSNSYRTSARQRVESQANRLTFWMLFPTITCLFVAAAIVLIGPVFLQFVTGGESSLKIQEIQKSPSRKVESFRGSAQISWRDLNHLPR